MSEEQSLSDLMNAMVSRLEYTHPEDMQSVPEEKQWALITTYMSVDAILASLYKQYCEAKDNLGKLLIENGDQDPMTEIAWDMHDSLRSAIETRLLELKDDKDITNRVAAIQANKFTARMMAKPKKKSTHQSLNEMMAFMLWAGMVMKSGQMSQMAHDIRRDFGKAS